MLPPRIASEKPRRSDRIRCPSHLKWVRGFQCSVPGCDRRPIEAAHVRNGTNGGMGQKPDDCWVISLCRDHHSEQHRIGEPEFERRYRIDMKEMAAAFAKQSPHRMKLQRKEK